MFTYRHKSWRTLSIKKCIYTLLFYIRCTVGLALLDLKTINNTQNYYNHTEMSSLWPTSTNKMTEIDFSEKGVAKSLTAFIL